jgi:HD-like signal output (HDOD) protein
MVALAEESGLSLADAEQEVFGTTHADVGAYLLQLWNFPGSLVEVVAFHQNPSSHAGSEPDTLTFLHVANALAAEQCIVRATVDDSYLAMLGIADRLESWEELAGAAVV